MKIITNQAQEASRNGQRLPWHKPEIERLTVSLDTANGTTSGPDGLHTGLAAVD